MPQREGRVLWNVTDAQGLIGRNVLGRFPIVGNRAIVYLSSNREYGVRGVGPRIHVLGSKAIMSWISACSRARVGGEEMHKM